MKTLYLVRHAQTEDPESGGDDFTRALTEHGRAQAKAVGKELKAKGVKLDRLIASTALRAQTTAHIIAETLGLVDAQCYEEPAIYNAPIDAYFRLINTLDDQDQAIMLIGHNPTISTLTRTLSHTTMDDMSPCAVYALEFTAELWSQVVMQKGEVVFTLLGHS